MRAFLLAVGVLLSNPIFGATAPQQIEIQNCVLAKVNGKPITLLDLTKKMDLIFREQFPQYRDVPMARLEFYKMSWEHFLKELIQRELILADAEEAKQKPSPAEVRSEVDRLFGPNVAATLDELGLTLVDAQETVKGDILFRRMLYGRVQIKALEEVTPQKVLSAYGKYAQEHRNPERWRYRVISFRGEGNESVAKSAHTLLTREKVPIDGLIEALKGQGYPKELEVKVSQEFSVATVELSDLYKESLKGLTSNSYSLPLEQKGTYRIFYLLAFESEGSDPFDKVEGKLKAELLETAFKRDYEAYITKLRRRFAVEESKECQMRVPNSFILY